MGHTIEMLSTQMERSLEKVMAERFPSYYASFPEEFLSAVVQDVYETSGWRDEGVFTEDDISLAIQREVLRRMEGDGVKVVVYVHGGMVQDVYASDPHADVTVIDEDVPEEERQVAQQPPFHVY